MPRVAETKNVCCRRCHELLLKTQLLRGDAFCPRCRCWTSVREARRPPKNRTEFSIGERSTRRRAGAGECVSLSGYRGDNIARYRTI